MMQKLTKIIQYNKIISNSKTRYDKPQHKI